MVLGAVGLLHVAAVRAWALERGRHEDVLLLARGPARCRLRGRVAVRARLALVDLLAAVGTGVAVTAAARRAGRRPVLVLLVFLLGVVFVLGVRFVLSAVRLAHVAVVRPRTRDRDRHVDVRL